MIAYKPPMGWNSWNTFGEKINEKLIMETADALVEFGYKDLGYEYLIIDDCWSLRERVDGKIKENPELFPHGMKYIADYIHSKGLKFGMYSCAGYRTCGDFPGSYGHEFTDAETFASWDVDYLKYDFCYFPESANAKNAYLTMSMALRNCGRDILFAACNWGVLDSSSWMRSIGAHTYRSTGDINDSYKSFSDIFTSQYANLENNGPGCYNDMDMLVTGMNGAGNVGIKGCTTDQYRTHFAMWAMCCSPLIIGCDIRNLADEYKQILQNKNIIAINQDEECRPPFSVVVQKNKIFLVKFLSGGKFAIGVFAGSESEFPAKYIPFSLDDIGIHSESGKKLKLTDAFTGEEFKVVADGCNFTLTEQETCKVFIGELV